MSMIAAVVALPFAAALTLALLPSGRLRGRVDFALTGTTLLLACAVAWELGARFGPPRPDALAVLVMVLTTGTATAERWVGLGRDRRSWALRAAKQIELGGMLLAAACTDLPLIWYAVVIAAAAALFRDLSRPDAERRRILLAAAALGLALFGTIALDAGADSVLAPGCLLAGYATVAALAPEMIPVVLLIALRLRDITAATPLGVLTDAILGAFGLGAVLVCAVGLIIRADGRRGQALIGIGQGGIAALAFGLNTAEATLAGIVHLILLTLSQAALLLARDNGPARVFASAGLVGLPPFGVFSGLVLVMLATAHRNAWLLPPLAAGIAVMGWSVAVRLPTPRGSLPVRPSAAWLPLILTVVLGLAMPEQLVTWLRAISAGGR